jgi:hypothetical protein
MNSIDDLLLDWMVSVFVFIEFTSLLTTGQWIGKQSSAVVIKYLHKCDIQYCTSRAKFVRNVSHALFNTLTNNLLNEWITYMCTYLLVKLHFQYQYKSKLRI